MKRDENQTPERTDEISNILSMPEPCYKGYFEQSSDGKMVKVLDVRLWQQALKRINPIVFNMIEKDEKLAKATTVAICRGNFLVMPIAASPIIVALNDKSSHDEKGAVLAGSEPLAAYTTTSRSLFLLMHVVYCVRTTSFNDKENEEIERMNRFYAIHKTALKSAERDLRQSAMKISSSHDTQDEKMRNIAYILKTYTLLLIQLHERFIYHALSLGDYGIPLETVLTSTKIPALGDLLPDIREGFYEEAKHYFIIRTALHHSYVDRLIKEEKIKADTKNDPLFTDVEELYKDSQQNLSERSYEGIIPVGLLKQYCQNLWSLPIDSVLPSNA